MAEKFKLVIFLPTQLSIEEILEIAARTANRALKTDEKTFAGVSAIDFKTLKFEGAFGHHSFFRNIEKANAIYTIDAEEITPSFIWALDKIQETIRPKLYSFLLEEVSKP